MPGAASTRDRIAVIADVHGNSWALDAVLADIDARGIDRIVALGDHLYGPLDPSGAAERLMERGVLAVRGNEDRLTIEAGDMAPRFIDWLDSMPTTLEPEPGVLAFHGTPASDVTYFLWRLEDGTLSQADEIEVGKRVQAIVADMACCGSGAALELVLCAHDHVPRAVCLDGALVVDPGSVGLQAYDDDVPVRHSMESGTSHARYAVVRRTAGGWVSEPVRLEYDWDAAAECAADNGRDDWARWLTTGRAG